MNLHARARVTLAVTLLAVAPVGAWAAAGRTQGTFNVSQTGAATYTIPIWAPHGPNGLEPHISLAYNSRIGNSYVGVGWYLAGLSSIYRCNLTFAQDAAPAPVKLATSDGLCLDGRRLRLTGGTYGAAGSTYQTEIANFANVTAYGAAGNGPAYFIVRGKDGRTYTYGNGGNSQVLATGTSTALLWLLNSVSDRAGNTMTIAYSTATGTAVPSTISWTPDSHGSTNYNYTMTFSYGTNVPQSSYYGQVAGTTVTNTNLLGSISVAYSGATVRKYVLSYQTSPTTGRDELKQIQECADSGATDCLSPTVITYQNGTAGVSTSATQAVSNNSGGRPARYDLNGDGFTDLIYRNGSYWYVTFGSASGYGTPVTTGISYSSTMVPGDLLGTGKAGLLANNGGTWYFYTWNGTSFAGTTTGLAYDSTANQYVLADTNGDGRPDLVAAYLTANEFGGFTLTVYTRLNTSSASTPSFASTTTLAYTNAALTQVSAYLVSNSDGMGQTLGGTLPSFDFDGDGRQDLGLISIKKNSTTCNPCTYTVNTFELVSSGSTFTGTLIASLPGSSPLVAFLNWNSDSCTDYLVSNYVYVSACNGSALGALSLGSVSVIGTMDWDGDGRTDLLVNNGSTIGVYLSTGVGLSSLISTAIPYSASIAYFTVDANGDGLDDLGYSNTSGVIGYYPHSGVNTPPDFLATISDGYGVVHSPTYVPITQGNYTKYSSATYPEQDYIGPVYVVSQVSASDGIGGNYTNSFWYYGAVQNLAGRGFEGFAKRRVYDSRSGLYAYQYYQTAFPYTGMLWRDDLFQSDNATSIKHTQGSLASITLSSTAYNQRYFPYLSSTATDTYEVGGSKNGLLVASSAASFSYDNYGNVTTLTSTITDEDNAAPASPTYGQTWATTVSNTISPDTGNWCLGIPTQTTLTRSATSVSAIARTINFTPDYSNCRVTQSVIEPSSSTYKVTTDYGYDSFGNINSTTVTGIGMTARPTTTDWGTTGQFVRTSTNALNQTSQVDYDYSRGLRTSAKDPNNILTSWSYDSFGRLQQETRPDGTYTTYGYNDCASVSGGCQNGDPASGATGINKLVVIATQKDTANTTIRDEWTYLDQFDRRIVVKTKTLSGGYSRVGTQYYATGEIYRQTAPCDAASCTVYWTSNSYDVLHRLTQQQRPVSASNPALQTTTVTYLGLTTVVTDPQSKTKTKVVDPNGWLRQSKDHSGYYQSFTYDAFGSLKTVTDSLSNALFSANYAYGIGAFQTGTTDMDRGSWTYTVDALGEVTAYTDANGSAFSMTYDALSRPLTRYVAGAGTTTWTWGNSAASYDIGKLASLTSTNGTTETYTYDNKGRLINRNIVADTTYNYDYAYSSTTGLLDTVTYPTSTSSYRLKLQYGYTNGLPQQIKDYNAGTIFWQANSANPRGEITQETLGNGIVTNRSFDAVTGWLNSIQSGLGGGTGAQNEAYLYDEVGNVIQRQNNSLGLTESFYYDDLYRLDYSQLNGTTNLNLTYDAMGRITNRTDVANNATWTYDTNRKHAVIQAGTGGPSYTYDANGNVITRNGQSITWSKYNYPTLINNSSSESAALYYDASNRRWKQVYVNGSTTETTYYIGDLMEKVVTSGGTDYRHYIYAQAGTAAVAIMSRTSGGTNTTRYILEDHQQSPSTIRDSSGNLVVNESFTAYGLRRNPATWSGAPSSGDLNIINGITRQGYTWQTALGNMGLNHMNGRVQDAVIGRFLSPDPYVPDSANTQSFDRYTYVLNNPLSLTDPTGFQDTRSPVFQQPISYGHNAPGGGSSPFVQDPDGGGWLIPDELFVRDTSPYGYVDSAIPTIGVNAGRFGSSEGNGGRRSGSQRNTQSATEKSKPQDEKPKKPELSKMCHGGVLETVAGLLDEIGQGGMDDGDALMQTGFVFVGAGQAIAATGGYALPATDGPGGAVAAFGGVLTALGGFNWGLGYAVKGLGAVLSLSIGSNQPLQSAAVQGAQWVLDDRMGLPSGAPSPLDPITEDLRGTNPCP